MKTRNFIRKCAAAFAAAVALAATQLCVTAAPARADAFASLSGLQPVSDATLGGIRGKYVPPAPAGHTVAAIPTVAAARALGRGDGTFTGVPTAASDAAPSMGGLASIGHVVYFGVSMVSTWQQQVNGATQGVSVGATLGVNLESGAGAVSTWSTSQNGGLPAGNGNDGDAGSPLSIVSSGVGQSIQVSGNGNTILNQASVQIGTAAPGAGAAGGNNCGNACNAGYDNGTLGVSIDTAQGAVSQTLGPNGIMQSAQVFSNMNQIANQLRVQVQVAPPSSSEMSGIDWATLLQTINGLH